MKLNLKIIFLPFVLLSLSGCIFNIDKKETDDVSHEVNIGEFRSAVNLNYKNFTLISRQTKNGAESDYTTVKCLEDGTFYQKCNENNSEYYWKRDNDGSFIHINKYGNNWIVDQVVNKLDFETDYYTDDSELLWTINDLVGSYTEFTYNSSTSFYESTITIKGESNNISLKFDNRKLVDAIISSSNRKIKINISNYNATTIDFNSLQVKNNLYVSGRTFTFKELRLEKAITGLNVSEFNTKNKDATLIFDATENFSMHFAMNFMSPFTACDYTGTYTYNKLNQTVSLMVLFNYSTVNVRCDLTIDSNNLVSGALLTARLYASSYNLDAYMDFYIK